MARTRTFLITALAAAALLAGCTRDARLDAARNILAGTAHSTAQAARTLSAWDAAEADRIATTCPDPSTCEAQLQAHDRTFSKAASTLGTATAALVEGQAMIDLVQSGVKQLADLMPLLPGLVQLGQSIQAQVAAFTKPAPAAPGGP